MTDEIATPTDAPDTDLPDPDVVPPDETIGEGQPRPTIEDDEEDEP